MFSDEITLQLKGEEILVTGGCGFLGSEITKQLSNIGAKVTVVDNLSSGKKSYIEGLEGVVGIDEGLKKTTSWYIQNESIILRDLKTVKGLN